MHKLLTTEIDYLAQEFYMAHVSFSIRDKTANTTVGSGGGIDWGGNGAIYASTQVNAVYDHEYETTAVHHVRYQIQDIDDEYIDGWGVEPVYGSEGETIGLEYVPYYGNGPRYNSISSQLRLGKSASATVALNMPFGYTPGRSEWDRLKPAEKRFVLNNLLVAIAFHAEREWADAQVRDRF